MKASSEWILVSAITIILIGTLISLLILRRKTRATRTYLEQTPFSVFSEEGTPVPLLQSFSGLKWLAPLSFGGNNVNPLLVFYSDHFVYRAIVKRKAFYDDIKTIRSFHSPYYNTLRFVFDHRIVYFTAVFGNEQTLLAVLDLLAVKGIRPDKKSRL